ncbi:MAG: glycosyltransferase family 39 protein [Verrucomicrobiae bacterium]|nr:glycosyltransferase family 39 protein [Verrucomicrobiae bacterium]
MRRSLSIGLGIVLVCLTVLRLWGGIAVELIPQEAYYWLYAQHPALCYYDHPPVTAWMVRAGVALLGDTELGVRLAALVCSLLACGLMFWTGRLWFGDQAALAGTLLFALAPLFAGMGLIMTPDVPVVLFWVAAMFAISKALLTGRTAWWLASGAMFGAAMLSKYTAVLLGPSWILFLLLSPAHRRWLRKPQPWLAALVALLLLTPVICWNAQHEWASLLFGFRGAGKPRGNPFENVLWFFASQFLVVTPPVLVLCAWALGRGIRRGWFGREDGWNFVASFCVPTLLVLLLSSLNKRIHPNWPCLMFPSLFLGAGALLTEGLASASPTVARWWRRGAWVTAGTLLASVGLGASVILCNKPEALLPDGTGGWRALASAVREARNNLARRSGQQPFVLGADKFHLPSALAFYLREPDDVVNEFVLDPKRGLGFRYWTDLDRLKGRPAVIVADKVSDRLTWRLGLAFERVEAPRRIEVRPAGLSARAFFLVDCHGYRGRTKKAGP